MAICRKCKTEKALQNFAKDPTRRGGLSYWCKDCHKSYNKNRLITLQIKEKRKNTALKYYYSHKKECLLRHKRWVKNNKDRDVSLKKKWREKNKEKSRVDYNNWVKQNPDKISILNKNKRARKTGAVGNHTLGEWEKLKKKYGYACPRCKKQEPEIKLTEDHITPLSKGGGNGIDNIQPLCRSCNSIKGTTTNYYII